MKHYAIIISIFTIIISSNAYSQEDGIKFFKGSWNELLAESKKNNKPIFVDAYAIWCGPCKYMNANVFTDKAVGEFYNKNFVNYKFDMERGEGPTFAKEYGVRAYPTLFFLNADGSILHKSLGGKKVDMFLDLGQDALKKLEKAKVKK